MDFFDIGYAYQTFLYWFSAIYHSWFFFAIKFFLGVYTIVLFIDLILLILLHSTKAIRTTFYGAEHPAAFRMQNVKIWKKIQERMKTGNISQHKAAVLEADKLVEDVLERLGFSGKNMAERLATATDTQIENKEKLQWAHDIRNKIIRDERFELDGKTAKDVIEVYADFLDVWEAL